MDSDSSRKQNIPIWYMIAALLGMMIAQGFVTTHN